MLGTDINTEITVSTPWIDRRKVEVSDEGGRYQPINLIFPSILRLIFALCSSSSLLRTPSFLSRAKQDRNNNLGHVHTYTFPNKNAYICLRFGLPSERKRPFQSSSTENFKNALQSGAIRKCRLIVYGWTGRKRRRHTFMTLARMLSNQAVVFPNRWCVYAWTGWQVKTTSKAVVWRENFWCVFLWKRMCGLNLKSLWAVAGTVYGNNNIIGNNFWIPQDSQKTST